jgi:adenylosuccinate lyase
MLLTPLTALSPLDGRYVEKTANLRPIMSEYGLIRFRVMVEVRWLLTLLRQKSIPNLPKLSKKAEQKLAQLYTEFNLQSAQQIKDIEKTTNHDVKAVEYFLQHQCENDTELAACIPLIHFACTSEDINNLAYALMLTEARDQVISPAMDAILKTLHSMAADYAEIPMLARTHGQPASPTTLGKECANFIARLQPIYHAFATFKLPGKMNGAVGNFNAHYAAYPQVDWPVISQQFIAEFGLFYNEYTTQIEPHDRLAEWLQTFMRFNTVLIDYCRDVWSYISLGYFQQKVIAAEVGSSTMPHKVNPIDFENAEGNLGLANALADHLVNKLPISRWQRDLTDSTVMRNLGSIMGYALIAYQSLHKGQQKIIVNKPQISEDLLAHGEVIAEGVQTILRRYGVSEAYEQLKALTRGKRFDHQQFLSFIEQLSLPAEAKKELRSLNPSNYLGCAVSLAKKISNNK